MSDALAPASGGPTDACLVVEDDSIIRLDLEQTLRDFGFASVIGASGVDAARRAAGTARICLAVLDHEMGRGNTLELAEQLVAEGIPTVFLSAHGEAIGLPPALAHIDVVAKPFDPALLAQALHSAMARSPEERRSIPCARLAG
jgi:CheY-like chemotaxis protein